jgi:hypothetical protein
VPGPTRRIGRSGWALLMTRLPLETGPSGAKFPLATDDADVLYRQTLALVAITEVTPNMEVEMSLNSPKNRGRRHRRAVFSFRRGLLVTATALATIGSPFVEAHASVVQPDTQQVLHYFSKFESQVFLTTSGKPFSPSEKNQPVPGDSIEGTNLDYVGNHVHHATNWTASDHELCVLDDKGNAVCHAEVAIGGSMILAQANLGHVSASTSASTFQITGGTGIYQGVTGTIVAVQLDPSAQTSNSDATITLQR